MNAPHPDSDTWPQWRNDLVQTLQRRLLDIHGVTPYDYQDVFLFPPTPYSLDTLKLIQLAGAKRTGKSFFLALRIEPYCLIPRTEIRIYGVEYENTQREFNHLVNLLFRGDTALCKTFPAIETELVEFNEDPDAGALRMKWSWGAQITSRSWERRNKWLGEPIDLGIISEPGLFQDIKIYTKYIEPNLTDRRGHCYSAGTVDHPWMEDLHKEAHDPDERPDLLCICEIPQWMNRSLGLTRDDIARKRLNVTARDFAINMLGEWGVYEDYAYNTEWTAANHTLVIDRASWLQLKKGKAGWDRFLALDTGRYKACGEYVVSPQGFLMMIDEHTNYEYRQGQIVQNDESGFSNWFRNNVLRSLRCRNTPIVYVDPASQHKQEIQELGIGWVDAQNAHDVGVDNVNQYLHQRKLRFVRPEGRPRYICEQEIPRVRWAETESGVGGRHRLRRENAEHSADQVRYAAASKPLGEEWNPERKKSQVEIDDEWEMMQRHSDVATFSNMPAMGSPGDV